jgi:hypothetical protein
VTTHWARAAKKAAATAIIATLPARPMRLARRRLGADLALSVFSGLRADIWAVIWRRSFANRVAFEAASP